MGSLSHLGIGLSFLFGCLLLGFIAELYYVLWWKKRLTNRAIQDPIQDPSHPTTELSYLFCWRSPIGSNRKQELPISVKRPTNHVNGLDQDLQMLKNYNGEEGVESELMRLHNLCGPPRFLFTIKEETKEDLESEDGKSRGEISFGKKGSRNKSLGELLACVETPYLTPLASPSLKSQSLECYNHHGFNPLFESSTDAEINKLRFSPPPKFKFLRDAEEKLMKKLMEAAERKCQYIVEEKDVSIVTVVSESKQVQSHSTASSQTRSAAENALRERQKKIGNRMIYCQLASDGPAGANSGVDGNGRKIFVANVASHVNPEMLKLFFEKFGELEEGPSGLDSVSGKFRGYCFFVYKNSEGCKKALEEPVKVFDDCRLECRLAIEGFKNNKNQNQARLSNNEFGGFNGATNSEFGSNMTYNVGVNPAFYGNQDFIGQNSGFGLANPMMVPSLNQNGLATANGANPQTIGFGGNHGINSVSPSVIASYASLQGLGAYQAQVGNSSVGSTVAARSQSSGHGFTGQAFSSHFRL